LCSVKLPAAELLSPRGTKHGYDKIIVYQL
jgi:hypothetical protein